MGAGCPTSPFLPCFEALSESCRILLSAFKSALLLAGLSARAGVSEAGTGTGAGAGVTTVQGGGGRVKINYSDGSKLKRKFN